MSLPVRVVRRATSRPRRLLAKSSSLASTSTLPITPVDPSAPVPRLLAYAIKRTPSERLPVYLEVKSGGQRMLTVIRKIDGSLEVRSNL